MSEKRTVTPTPLSKRPKSGVSMAEIKLGRSINETVRNAIDKALDNVQTALNNKVPEENPILFVDYYSCPTQTAFVDKDNVLYHYMTVHRDRLFKVLGLEKKKHVDQGGAVVEKPTGNIRVESLDGTVQRTVDPDILRIFKR